VCVCLSLSLCLCLSFSFSLSSSSQNLDDPNAAEKFMKITKAYEAYVRERMCAPTCLATATAALQCRAAPRSTAIMLRSAHAATQQR